MKTNKTLNRLNWLMWEKILVATGWLFGYDHPAYFGVKHNRNMAYFKYRFNLYEDKK